MYFVTTLPTTRMGGDYFPQLALRESSWGLIYRERTGQALLLSTSTAVGSEVLSRACAPHGDRDDACKSRSLVSAYVAADGACCISEPVRSCALHLQRAISTVCPFRGAAKKPACLLGSS